ncbi:MAG TPA: hypothetical protein VFE53_03005 [Mucilaginibacter sp.]|jgi:hypothetical protein|nr:hypothetical protein [Mucilaginibacter sp.]
MKILFKLKTPVIILLVSLAWFSINSCQKSGSGHDDNPPPPPAPKVSITQTPLNILLPGNCTQSFTITNTGPKGSMLTFTVADDGALGGFLDFGNSGTNSDTPVSYTLASGESNTISVIVNPNFVNAKPSLIGATLVLNVYTPGASNYTKIPVPVNIESNDIIAPSLIGTWSGTWSGMTRQLPAVPVSGTWKMNITAVDTVKSTLTGSITWTGNDALYTFSNDMPGGNPDSLVYDPVNITIPLNGSIASFTYGNSPAEPSNATCHGINFNFDYTTNPNYALTFYAEFNTVTNTIIPGSGSFLSGPDWGLPITLGPQSVGSLIGSKQ